MSTVRVTVETIQGITAHPNADRLAIATVKDFPCVVGLNQFQPGDKAIYFPTDIVMPDELVEKLFANSKIKPSKGRIRACKIRGAFSEGLLVPLSDYPSIADKAKEGDDLTDYFKCKKYEPPEVNIPGTSPSKNSTKRYKKLQLPRYTDTQRAQGMWDKVFPDPAEVVVVTAKLHGTSARYGWVKVVGKSWLTRLWLYIRERFGKPKYEFVVGTRNVDRSINEDNVYAKVARQLDLPSKMKIGEVLFGEIVGHGIQGKGFDYGCKPGEFRFYAYCVSRSNVNLPYDLFNEWCFVRNIDTVPLITVYHAVDVLPNTATWHKQRTYIEDKIPCREGFVVAPYTERSHAMCGSRTVLKFINPEYLLLKEPGDNH